MCAVTRAISTTGFSTRVACLDGVRAIAATLIVVHHVGFTSGATSRTGAWYGPLLGRFDIGVPIFFVLSGFLLYRPFAASLLAGGEAPAAKGFWWRRFLRVFPAYWVALVLMAVLGAIAVGGIVGFVVSFLLVHSYHPGTFAPDKYYAISGITQSWSLVAEIMFYALLPLWHGLVAGRFNARSVRAKAAAMLAGTVAWYAASIVFRVMIAAVDPSWQRITPQWFFANADIFAIGMAFAVVSVWGVHNRTLEQLLNRLGQHAGRWWLVAVATFWFTATQLDLALGLKTAGFGRETARQALYGLVGALVIAPLIFRPNVQSPLRRVLDSSVMRWLGTVSYGIYIWHQLFIHQMQIWFGWETFTGHFWSYLVGTMIMTCVAAWLSHRLLEQPLARRFSGLFR